MAYEVVAFGVQPPPTAERCGEHTGAWRVRSIPRHLAGALLGRAVAQGLLGIGEGVHVALALAQQSTPLPDGASWVSDRAVFAADEAESNKGFAPTGCDQMPTSAYPFPSYTLGVQVDVAVVDRHLRSTEELIGALAPIGCPSDAACEAREGGHGTKVATVLLNAAPHVRIHAFSLDRHDRDPSVCDFLRAVDRAAAVADVVVLTDYPSERHPEDPDPPEAPYAVQALFSAAFAHPHFSRAAFVLAMYGESGMNYDHQPWRASLLQAPRYQDGHLKDGLLAVAGYEPPTPSRRASMRAKGPCSLHLGGLTGDVQVLLDGNVACLRGASALAPQVAAAIAWQTGRSGVTARGARATLLGTAAPLDQGMACWNISGGHLDLTAALEAQSCMLARTRCSEDERACSPVCEAPE
ncbi:MAG: hypothetical protein H6702_03590 [Myxococcales bacterium]|nr:hypothetical protein [Myxococcales bacterium]